MFVVFEAFFLLFLILCVFCIFLVFCFVSFVFGFSGMVVFDELCLTSSFTGPCSGIPALRGMEGEREKERMSETFSPKIES